jgi:serine/threonine protein kinase
VGHEKPKKFEEKWRLFLAGNIELYGNSVIADCLPGHKYDSFLGQGGEAGVFKVKNEGLNRFEVLKILLPELSDEARKRFFRGARILAQIWDQAQKSGTRPPFPYVYAVNDEPPYIWMQWIDGVTLYDYLEKQAELGLYQKLRMFYDLCLGAHLLHQRGIVHRDIKPGNILVDSAGKIWMIDFGLAKSCYESEYTRVDAMLGTPDYAAPEQMLNAAQVDYRADIYSLAKVLYFMITMDETFSPEQLPVELLMVIPRATQHDKERRHQSVMELWEEVSKAYPDYNVTGQKLDIVDIPVATAFSDLIILMGGNTGKVKKLLQIESGELGLWEELMRMARQGTIDRTSL